MSSAHSGQSLNNTVMTDDEQHDSYWFSPILHHSFFLKIAAQRIRNRPLAAPAAHYIQLKDPGAQNLRDPIGPLCCNVNLLYHSSP